MNHNILDANDLQTGFPCPECQTHIPTTLEAILSQKELSCAKCGLSLTLDSIKSSEGLKAAQVLQEGLAKADSIREAGMPPEQGKKRSRRERRSRKPRRR